MISALLSVNWSLTGGYIIIIIKNKRKCNLLALKVIAVAYERW